MSPDGSRKTIDVSERDARGPRAKAALAMSLIVLVLACSRSAFAQTSYQPEQGEWEASIFAGGSFAGNYQFPTPVSGSDQEFSRSVGMRYIPGYQIGLRVSQNLNDFWGVDLEYSFANQELQLTNLSPSIQRLSLCHFIHDLTYNVSYLPLRPTKRFRPYADVGVGAALFYICGRSRQEAMNLGLDIRSSWEFVGNWGGGFKYLIADHYAVTFDLKDRLSRIPSYGIPVSARVVGGQFQPGISLHGVMQNWQINFGFSYQWDE